MANESVMAVAAWPGVIIDKYDGNFDQSCSLNNTIPWNAIYIQHDGKFDQIYNFWVKLNLVQMGQWHGMDI